LIVALDATYSAGPALSGVGVYSRELMAELAALRPDDTFLHCYRPHRLWRGVRAARPSNARARPLLERWQPFRCDLFHGLNQRMPSRRFARSVCTFHDLFVLTEEFSTAEFRARFAQQAREAAERADLIVCVSAYTASQAESLLGVERARLRVVHHGTRFLDPVLPERREPWVLHVGAVQRRKNLARLIEAFERAAPPPWRLVLAGGDGYGSAEVRARAAASPACARIDFPGWVDDARLRELYARASVFAFPSLGEGFGIPVLEAMASALPVIASNGSSLPEICGDAAALIDPLDVESLEDALRTFIAEPARRAELGAQGQARARTFTWRAAAASTLAIYDELR